MRPTKRTNMRGSHLVGNESEVNATQSEETDETDEEKEHEREEARNGFRRKLTQH
jgi:hypothetical protein